MICQVLAGQLVNCSRQLVQGTNDIGMVWYGILGFNVPLDTV